MIEWSGRETTGLRGSGVFWPGASPPPPPPPGATAGSRRNHERVRDQALLAACGGTGVALPCGSFSLGALLRSGALLGLRRRERVTLVRPPLGRQLSRVSHCDLIRPDCTCLNEEPGVTSWRGRTSTTPRRLAIRIHTRRREWWTHNSLCGCCGWCFPASESISVARFTGHGPPSAETHSTICPQWARAGADAAEPAFQELRLPARSMRACCLLRNGRTDSRGGCAGGMKQQVKRTVLTQDSASPAAPSTRTHGPAHPVGRGRRPSWPLQSRPCSVASGHSGLIHVAGAGGMECPLKRICPVHLRSLMDVPGLTGVTLCAGAWRGGRTRICRLLHAHGPGRQPSTGVQAASMPAATV